MVLKLFRKLTNDLTAVDELENFLHEYNCKYHVVNEGEKDSVKRYLFDYQGGHFICNVYESDGVELVFPNCFDAPLEQLSNMRSTCNRFNNIGIRFKCTYVIDDEKNVVNLNVVAYCTTVARDMKGLLDTCFGVARDFAEEYAKNTSQGNNSGIVDHEEDDAVQDRELFLLKQQEFATQPDNQKVQTDPSTGLTVGSLLSNVLGETDAECDNLTRFGQQGDNCVLNDSREIADFNLESTIITDGQLADTDVVLLLKYHNRERPNLHKTLTVLLSGAGSDNTTLFYRVTVSRQSQPLNRTNTLDHERPECGLSFLVAHDIASYEKKAQEFDYMWKDAMIAQKELGWSNLDKQQQLIVDIQQGNVAYDAYWGFRHFLKEDYYTALLYFENAIKSLKPELPSMSKRQTHVFNQLCYHAGLCCNALHQYEKACYYLHFIFDIGQIKFAMAYVIALVRLNDANVFKVITHLKKQIEDSYDEEDELPKAVTDFLAFLKRNWAQMLINTGRLDDAEDLLKKMMEANESSDFVIKGLAEITRRRSKDSDKPTDECTKI